jgi:hypothetical protein
MQSTVGEYKYLALAGPLFPALIFHLARFVDGTGGGGSWHIIQETTRPEDQ